MTLSAKQQSDTIKSRKRKTRIKEKETENYENGDEKKKTERGKK